MPEPTSPEMREGLEQLNIPFSPEQLHKVEIFLESTKN